MSYTIGLPKVKQSAPSMRPAILLLAIILATLTVLTVPNSFADTHEFGGWEERFKGKGDLEPPLCQVGLPRGSTVAFSILWNCTDNYTPSADISSELWCLRKGAQAPEKIKDFLGFPACLQINESVLQTASVASGLPASFRVVARDRAGNVVMTPYLQVVPQDIASQENSLTSCSLTINTESTESTGGTTGLPEMNLTASDAAVATRQTSDTSITITTSSAAFADPCEIESMCSNEDKITFSSSLTFAAQSTSGSSSGSTQSSISGSIQIAPGSVAASLKGTASMLNGQITAVEASGTSTIEGAPATINLDCTKADSSIAAE